MFVRKSDHMKKLAYTISVLAALANTPAAAQSGSMEPQVKPSYTESCPSGWSDRRNGAKSGTCYPQSGATPIYPAGSSTSKCPTGFGHRQGWCVKGDDTYLTDRARGKVIKANLLDRCPIAYFTNNEAPNTCITMAANPPSVRLKGSGACRSGEVDDWGIYCVSDYGGLERGPAATGLRDWNAIYGINGGKSPIQADLAEGTQYTPAYLTIFGRVKSDGSPMRGGASAAPSSTGASAANASGATPNPCRSATGAAIGGAIAGEGGAALGGMLGGLGKKKKSAC